MAITYGKNSVPSLPMQRLIKHEIEKWGTPSYLERMMVEQAGAADKADVEKRPVGRPRSGKARVTMLLDPDVLAKFRATGEGWQGRINAILKEAKL